MLYTGYLLQILKISSEILKDAERRRGGDLLLEDRTRAIYLTAFSQLQRDGFPVSRIQSSISGEIRLRIEVDGMSYEADPAEIEAAAMCRPLAAVHVPEHSRTKYPTPLYSPQKAEPRPPVSGSMQTGTEEPERDGAGSGAADAGTEAHDESLVQAEDMTKYMTEPVDGKAGTHVPDSAGKADDEDGIEEIVIYAETDEEDDEEEASAEAPETEDASVRPGSEDGEGSPAADDGQDGTPSAEAYAAGPVYETAPDTEAPAAEGGEQDKSRTGEGDIKAPAPAAEEEPGRPPIEESENENGIYRMDIDDIAYSSLDMVISNGADSVNAYIVGFPFKNTAVRTPNMIYYYEFSVNNDEDFRNGIVESRNSTAYVKMGDAEILITGIKETNLIDRLEVKLSSTCEKKGYKIAECTPANHPGAKDKGHIVIAEGRTAVHIMPLSAENNDAGFADFAYYITEDGRKIRMGHTDNESGIEFRKDDAVMKAVAKWKGGTLIAAVAKLEG